MNKSVNTYGMKMSGLKKAAGQTKDLEGYYSPIYLELFYDTESGEVWTKQQCSIGHCTWTVYRDKEVISCGYICDKMTMQQIADRVAENVFAYEQWFSVKSN